MSLTPEQLVTIILAGLGVCLQLAFMYLGKFSEWYQNHPQKSLLTLLFSAGFGAAYFGLSCTPFVIDLKIALTCTSTGLFILLRAIFLIALSQQLTYGFTK